MMTTMEAPVDRRTLFDLVAITVAAFLLYGATLLPGVGWGDGAALQTETALLWSTPAVPIEEFPASSAERPRASLFFTAPAHLFISVAPLGSPARRFNILMVVLSVSTLLVSYGLLRQVVSRPLSATMGVTALAFSHAFFLHAVRPSMMPMLALLFALLLLAAVRHLLLERGMELAAVWLLLLVMAVILPRSLFMTLPVALYVSARRAWKACVWKGMPLFWFLLLPLLVTVVGTSDFGVTTLILLALFAAFQFPVVGWLLAILGYRLLARRARPILDLAILAAVGGAPLSYGFGPADFMGSMLLSSLPALILIGAGVEHLLERVASRPEPFPILVPLLFTSLVLFPLLAAVSGATLVRATGIDTRLAVEAPTTVRIRDNPWNDVVWYALWPPKNGLGGGLFIEEAEAVLPGHCALLVDPEVGAALDYARRVEGRLVGVRPVACSQDEQMAFASLLAAEGMRIFLAGIDPAFYDVDGLGRMGVLIERGRFYEWIPSSR